MAFCKSVTKQEKLTYIQNKEALNQAPVKQSGRWRRFTRLEKPGEDIGKNRIKKGTYLLSEHKKGRPSLNKYKDDAVIVEEEKEPSEWRGITIQAHINKQT